MSTSIGMTCLMSTKWTLNQEKRIFKLPTRMSATNFPAASTGNWLPSMKRLINDANVSISPSIPWRSTTPNRW